MGIMDPIRLGPLELRPSETQAVGGHVAVEVVTVEPSGELSAYQPWAHEGGGDVNIPLTVWEQAQAAREAT